MKKDTEGLRFISVESESFMGLPNTVVHIDGRSLIISGRNEAGKSRFIQMLLSGIDSKSQATEIITKGQQKASVKTVIAGSIGGEALEYSVEMYYSVKNGSGRIVLTDKNGDSVKSPKEILKNLIGNISFDVMKFLNDTKKEKIKILKQLSGVGKEIDILDVERKKIYDDRTYLGKKIDENESVMNTHGLTPEEIDDYSEPVKIEPIQEELNSISKKITDWNGVKTKTEGFRKEFEEIYPQAMSAYKNAIHLKYQRIEEIKAEAIRACKVIESEIESINGDISNSHETAKEAEAHYAKGKAWLEKNHEPKAEEISKRLSDATLHNQNHEKVKSLAEKQKGLIADKKLLQKHTSDIEAIDEKKDKLIANSKLPVKGLRFTDEDIFYNNLPFEEKQQNTATLLNVGVEISKALNPGLRTIFIHSGSLFDKKHLNEVIKKAEKDGYQVIVEVVKDDGDLEINFIEEEGEQ